MINFRRLVEEYRSQPTRSTEHFGNPLKRLTNWEGKDDWRLVHTVEDAGRDMASKYHFLSKDIPKEDLQELEQVKILCAEMSKISLKHRRDGDELKRSHLEDLPARALALVEEFKKKLPTLVEKALAKAMKEAGVDLS